MKNPITIVGLGQLGSLVSYKLLQRGYPVRCIDSRIKYSKKNNQIPWGWVRKFSLQSKLKKDLMTNNFPIGNIDNLINSNKGPMLITGKNKSIINSWTEWIKANPDTDAKVLSPNDAYTNFNIPEDFLTKDGGLFMCDTRDTLIDYNLLNNFLWDYLENDPNCELISNCKVDSLDIQNNKAINIITKDKEYIPLDKTLLCIGNQTNNLLKKSYPILEITLPFAFINNIPKQEYIAIWNKYSSLNFFHDGKIKLGCGTQSIFDYKTLNFSSIYFAKMGLNGISNIHINKSNDYLIEKAITELYQFGIIEKPNIEYTTSCNIDLTPTLCPYIYYLPNAYNILSINGFSGSGSMILDDNFIDIIIQSILKNDLDNKLKLFKPSKSVLDNWYPPKEKITSLSSII